VITGRLATGNAFLSNRYGGRKSCPTGNSEIGVTERCRWIARANQAVAVLAAQVNRGIREELDDAVFVTRDHGLRQLLH
jgi:hypothetical protein